ERIKVMKLLWDAVGTEFAGRHALYEANYAGNHEDTRIAALHVAQRNGRLAEMTAMLERCLSDYGESGWTHTWVNPERLGTTR
ncbi:MAG TPA: 4-hydroxyphenylacetate 3-hydroxylase C-terminal domain-containing protein, partial [Xanthobacteraceae bacterium]|nr:4-hydroxyphenylacetate 3-hydroxylase C-terminal domain-containing protein [Xanthobacteraceae bacterium]